jgi:phage-related tail fiber protein
VKTPAIRVRLSKGGWADSKYRATAKNLGPYGWGPTPQHARLRLIEQVMRRALETLLHAPELDKELHAEVKLALDLGGEEA